MVQKISRRFWIAVFIFGCMAVAFAVRAIPALPIGDNGFLYTYDTDTWYAIRQVEVMVAQYPGYAWFDPMTAFPNGKTIGWGPLLPFVAASACRILGATTQGTIIGLSVWVSPILATLLIPVFYFLGRTVWDERTGLVAAGLATVLSFRFFFLSSYGYLDHHIMELFFSTLFLAVYLYFLVFSEKNPPDIHDSATLKIPVALAALAGFLYFLALITSTTVLLVIPVIALYTFVRIVLDYSAGKESLPILVLNCTASAFVILPLILFGITWKSFAFSEYSAGLILVILAVPAETLALFILARAGKGNKLIFGAGIFLLAVVGFGLVSYIPAFSSIGLAAQQLLLGQSAFSTVVQETLPWSVSTAWANFNLAIILMAAGLVILAYYCLRGKRNEHLFFLIWSLIMLFATIRYRRFEYYSTVNIVILAAICITEPFHRAGDDFRTRILSLLPFQRQESRVPDEKPGARIGGARGSGTPATRKGKKKQSAEATRRVPEVLKAALCIFMIFLTLLMVTISAIQDIDYAKGSSERRISPDWIESLDWLMENSPDTGVNYYRIYEKDSFTYPTTAYGIMASWSSGHWITFFAHRIPITNPFQDNLAGTSGAAAYFLSGCEPAADSILSSFGGKYVITDSDLAVDTFSSLVPWQNDSVDVTPYIKWFLVPSTTDPSQLLQENQYDDAYFQSMAVRLHMFDGSLTDPENVTYIEYTVREVPASGETADISGFAPVITRMAAMNATDAESAVQEFNRNAAANRRAIALSDMPDKPVLPVPALQHYRLVHESPEDATVTRFEGADPITLPGIKTVKIFEYVPGAVIPGEGVIEVPVRTNTGRVFVYRQASVNGTFTVPYPTTGSPYDVSATGPYHILGTDRYVSVTENDVIQGNTVPK